MTTHLSVNISEDIKRIIGSAVMERNIILEHVLSLGAMVLKQLEDGDVPYTVDQDGTIKRHDTIAITVPPISYDLDDVNLRLMQLGSSGTLTEQQPPSL